MKLPIPALLYSAAIGIFGWSGWTVYLMVPMWKKEMRDQATARGQKDGMDLITRGKGQGVESSVWDYGRSKSSWWEGFKNVNLIGKLPPPPPSQKPDEAALRKQQELEELDQRPLEEVIELVSLVHDSKEAGKGGNSYVIVRYKPDANVKPPEWWVRENTATAAAAARSNGPSDVTPSRGKPSAINAPPSTPPTSPQRPPNAGPGARSGSPMPTSITGMVILQKLWVQDDGDPRRSSFLWPVESQPATPGGKERRLGKVRLVRVAPDAQSAFFVREMPVVDPNAKAPEPKEEELLKTTMNLPQEVLRETRRLQGRPLASKSAGGAAVAPSGTWLDVQETTRVGKTTHIGRKDEDLFRQNSDQVFGKLQVDTYVSKSSNLRGLVVRNVEPELATKFGVVTGDVLIEINDRKVESKEQAIQFGKADYGKGVRTFTTKWLSNGQVVERTYQAPDR